MFRPDRLGPDLVELAPAPLLLLFMPEHRPEVVEPVESPPPVQGALDVGADNRSSRLRAQGHRTAALVPEGVHLLADDVRVPPDPAREQFGGLDDGGPDLPVPVALEDAARALLHEAPALGLPGEQVPRPRQVVG